MKNLLLYVFGKIFSCCIAFINKKFFSFLTSLTSKTEKIQKHVFIFDKFVPFAILYYIFRPYIFSYWNWKESTKNVKIKCKSKKFSLCIFFFFLSFAFMKQFEDLWDWKEKWERMRRRKIKGKKRREKICNEKFIYNQRIPLKS